MQIAKSSTHTALGGIWIILLSASVMATLYLAQAILIPLTLAALVTFLLAPMVTRMERWIGRIAAVLVVMLMLFIVTGLSGWVFSRQLMDLARKMPDYKENIEGKASVTDHSKHHHLSPTVIKLSWGISSEFTSISSTGFTGAYDLHSGSCPVVGSPALE